MRRHEHKSLNGCCICRCKSSTSRFAKSDVWEKYFPMCFLLPPRQRKGDICNACVLVVKRFCKKKKETTFEYVVDCRSGPGSKSMAKIKKKRNVIQKQLNAKERKGVDKLNRDEHEEKKSRKQDKGRIYRTLYHPSQLINDISFGSSFHHFKTAQSSSSLPPPSSPPLPPVTSSSSPPGDVTWRDIYMDDDSAPLPAYLEEHFKGYRVCCGVIYHSHKTGEVVCHKASYKPCPLHLQLAHQHLSSSSSSSPGASSSSSSSSSVLPASPLSHYDDETSQQMATNDEDDDDGDGGDGNDDDEDDDDGDDNGREGKNEDGDDDGEEDERKNDDEEENEEDDDNDDVGRGGVVSKVCYQKERMSFVASMVPMCF